MDQDLKKKILNTITGYEHKCDKMQQQVDAFKHIINQLIISSRGMNFEMDDHLIQLQNQLDIEFDMDALEEKANYLIKIPEKIQKKKAEQAKKIAKLVRKSAKSVEQLAKKPQDKRAVSQLQKMLDTEMESQAILVHFNQVLDQCVSSVVKELEKSPQILKKQVNGIVTPNEISPKVNASLQQLLHHLSIPQELDIKKELIKESLKRQLTSEELNKTIEELTELVVDAFNVEQNRFKGFLHQLTLQLQDFDVYLKSTVDSRKLASNESRQLEHGIQDDINQIKSDIDSSISLDELAGKVNQHLIGIGDRIKTYRANEKIRDEEYEAQVRELQAKLAESEQNTDEIKGLLSLQKYRINHDRLTGLPNRESYDEYLIESLQRWKRDSNILSLAVCDIDHFKRINDNFGHLAGDKVLKKVAEILQTSIRSSDFIARIGGEEFVLIFEGTLGKSAVTILEKLRKAINDCQFIYREKKVDVTVSFGLTTVAEGDDYESLFMRADNAMYKAKNAGRNRVEVL